MARRATTWSKSFRRGKVTPFYLTAAEALFMFYSNRSRDKVKAGGNKFFVSNGCYPQTIDVLRTRAVPYGIELVIGDHASTKLDPTFFGALIQYPDMSGEIHEYRKFVSDAKASEVQVAERVRSSVGLPAKDVVLVPPGSLPKTSSGKLQRSLCRQRYLGDELTPA
mgnify:CR=1 FL=1